MCLPYPSLSPAQPSSDEEEGERQSPPLEVSDGEADGLEPGPGLLHGETGMGPSPPSQPFTQASFVPMPVPDMNVSAECECVKVCRGECCICDHLHLHVSVGTCVQACGLCTSTCD